MCDSKGLWIVCVIEQMAVSPKDGNMTLIESYFNTLDSTVPYILHFLYIQDVPLHPVNKVINQEFMYIVSGLSRELEKKSSAQMLDKEVAFYIQSHKVAIRHTAKGSLNLESLTI